MERKVVAIGDFDGFHIGHRLLADNAKKVANKLEYLPTAVVITDLPSDKGSLLSTKTQKTKLLRLYGMKVVELSYAGLRRLSPEKFVKAVLLKKLNAGVVVVGKNFRFGANRSGDVVLLKRLGKLYGYKIISVPLLKAGNHIVSSTYIRKLISDGETLLPAKLLRRYYSVEGVIVHGRHIGRRIGYPTANVKIENGQLVPYGIYAVFIEINGMRYKGVVNIGYRPTFNIGNNEKVTVEVYLLDSNKQIYGSKVKLEFIKKLRAEKKFDSVDALVLQIGRDVNNAKVVLQNKKVFA
ncbi:MAG: riboflavin biosynthesis protein RibF [Elusimicrobiota bacterium]